MRQRVSVIVVALSLGMCANAAIMGAEEANVVGKDGRIELAVLVAGGEEPQPIRNAEVSIQGPDGSDLQSPRRTNKKGEVRFRGLPEGEIVILVIAKQWKTYKSVHVLGKDQEELQVTLQPLD